MTSATVLSGQTLEDSDIVKCYTASELDSIACYLVEGKLAKKLYSEELIINQQNNIIINELNNKLIRKEEEFNLMRAISEERGFRENNNLKLYKDEKHAHFNTKIKLGGVSVGITIAFIYVLTKL